MPIDLTFPILFEYEGERIRGTIPEMEAMGFVFLYRTDMDMPWAAYYKPGRITPLPHCTECGVKLPLGARFCIECGAAVAATGRTERLGE